jgi:glutathione S-transferase
MALDCERVAVAHEDRRAIETISGQPLAPVLCDEDRVVPDSTRILRYVVARYGERGLLPAGPAEQALAWIVEDYADEVLGPLVRDVLEGRSASGEAPAGRDRKEVDKHLETQFRNLEQLLSARGFMLGTAPCLADIAVFAFLRHLVRQGGGEVSAGFPHLKAWYARMDALG